MRAQAQQRGQCSWTCHRGRVGVKRRATGLTSVMKSNHLVLTHSCHLTHSPGTHLSSLRMLLLFHPTGLLSNVLISLAWLLFLIFFNGRIIALQCCVGLCHTTMWISHKYTHIAPPSWAWLSPSHPTPLGCHRSPDWVPCVMQQLPSNYRFTYGNVHVPVLLSQLVPPSASLAVSTRMFSLSASLFPPLHGF